VTDVDWAAGKATLCDIFEDRVAALAAADAAAVRAELRALLAQVPPPPLVLCGHAASLTPY
jgi:hypothetical protein